MSEKYQRKPQTVEAMQYRFDNRSAFIAWCGAGTVSLNVSHLVALTRGGIDLVGIGDWIVRYANDEQDVVSAERFVAEYEPAHAAGERRADQYREALEKLMNHVRHSLHCANHISREWRKCDCGAEEALAIARRALEPRRTT